MKPVFCLAVAFMACSPFAAHAAETPASGSHDSRVRYVVYDPMNVVEVSGAMRSVVELVFDPSEAITRVAVGDSIAWEVVPANNILFLKPRAQNPPANMIVVTKRPDGSLRSYNIELSIRAGTDDNLSVGQPDVMFQVVFRYPGDVATEQARAVVAARAVQQKAEVDYRLSNAPYEGNINWAYTAEGSSVLQPASVFDNGQVTTMTFPLNESIPSMFGILPDGEETLIDYSIHGTSVEIHGTYPQIRLRRGSANLAIFNLAYSHIGADPETGTTSAAVARVQTGSNVQIGQ